MRVTLFDYGAGNLHSLAKALASHGARSHRERSDSAPCDHRRCSSLPGVGRSQPRPRAAYACARERCATRSAMACRRSASVSACSCCSTERRGPGRGLGVIPGRVERVRRRACRTSGGTPSMRTRDARSLRRRGSRTSRTTPTATSAAPTTKRVVAAWTTTRRIGFPPRSARGAPSACSSTPRRARARASRFARARSCTEAARDDRHPRRRHSRRRVRAARRRLVRRTSGSASPIPRAVARTWDAMPASRGCTSWTSTLPPGAAPTSHRARPDRASDMPCRSAAECGPANASSELLRDGADASSSARARSRSRSGSPVSSSGIPGQIIVPRDVRERRVVTRGWARRCRRRHSRRRGELNGLPLAGLLVTAVHREGQMPAPTAPDGGCAPSTRFPCIASGGVATMERPASAGATGASPAP